LLAAFLEVVIVMLKYTARWNQSPAEELGMLSCNGDSSRVVLVAPRDINENWGSTKLIGQNLTVCKMLVGTKVVRMALFLARCWNQVWQ